MIQSTNCPENYNTNIFKNCEIGDYAKSVIRGWGKIQSFSDINKSMVFIEFDNTIAQFYNDGRSRRSDKYPEIIEIQQKNKNSYVIFADGDILKIDESYYQKCLYDEHGRVYPSKSIAHKAYQLILQHQLKVKYLMNREPNYVPNWNDTSPKYYVYFSHEYKCWSIGYVYIHDCGHVYMPYWVAEELKNDLNCGKINFNILGNKNE